MKRLFLSLLVLALLFLCACAPQNKDNQANPAAGSSAENTQKPEEYTSEDFVCVVRDDGSAKITYYLGIEQMLTVPDTLGGRKVTAVDDKAFAGCKTLVEITFPDSIVDLGGNLFPGCSSLTSVHVSPNHPALAVVDGVLFSKKDHRLVHYPRGRTETSYTVPDDVQIIGDSAFSACSALTRLSLPEGLTSIGDNAFSSCSGLTQITLPEGLTSIGNSAFSACSALTQITFPEGVTAIGDSAFGGCQNLAQVNFPEGLLSIGNAAFNGCSSLTRVTLPDGVTSIGNDAFSSCVNLAQVNLPEGVTSIGYDAFYACDKLTLTVSRDSYAHQYCQKNQLKCAYPED